MNIVTLDFETYYDQDYTLNKMTTEEYVRDERFEVHGCGIQFEPGTPSHWYPAPQLIGEKREDHGGLFGSIDWANTAILGHHMHFDGLILAHKYGIYPKLYLDTYSMARALLGTHIGKGLESLAAHFGLGAKTIPYDLFKGKHWWELDAYVRQQVAKGCCDDVSLTWDLFCKLAPAFPKEEYTLVDATVRMFTKPVLVGNTTLLGQIWQEEETKKNALLAQLGLTTDDIRKDWAFAKALREQGIEPPQKRMKDGKCKVCKGTGRGGIDARNECTECQGSGVEERWKYAFARTDDFMRELEDHEDEDVRLLHEAKLQAHGTGTQTRTFRLGWMSTRGPLCVYLNYCGTHIKGWSGGDKVNWQNFKRGGPIAKAIEAPKGCAIVVADSSQCECRLLEEVAGEDMTDWREGKDPYTTLATKFYQEEIYKAKDGDPRQFEMECKRGTGKQLRLSCGYGAGGPTIVITAKKGAYGPPVYLTDAQGMEARDLYRREKARVRALWSEAGDVLKKMHAGLEFEWGPVYIQDKRMWMPGDLPIIYETLKWEDDPDDGQDPGWRVRVNKNGWSKMYGAKFVENLIQGLRNSLVRQAWMRCLAAGLDMCSMEHDKLIAVVRVADAEAAYALIRQELSRPPEWLPNVPLDSEGYISDTFAKPEKK
jgi:DNA polymerase